MRSPSTCHTIRSVTSSSSASTPPPVWAHVSVLSRSASAGSSEAPGCDGTVLRTVTEAVAATPTSWPSLATAVTSHTSPFVVRAAATVAVSTPASAPLTVQLHSVLSSLASRSTSSAGAVTLATRSSVVRASAGESSIPGVPGAEFKSRLNSVATPSLDPAVMRHVMVWAPSSCSASVPSVCPLKSVAPAKTGSS